MVNKALQFLSVGDLLTRSAWAINKCLIVLELVCAWVQAQAAGSAGKLGFTVNPTNPNCNACRLQAPLDEHFSAKYGSSWQQKIRREWNKQITENKTIKFS